MAVSELPTTIFYGNDRMAMGSYMALQDLRLRIPQDVAVIGFDNQKIIAKCLRPPLSDGAAALQDGTVGYRVSPEPDERTNLGAADTVQA